MRYYMLLHTGVTHTQCQKQSYQQHSQLQCATDKQKTEKNQINTVIINFSFNITTISAIKTTKYISHQHVPVLFCSLAVLDPRVGHTMDVLSPFISVLCHSD